MSASDAPTTPPRIATTVKITHQSLSRVVSMRSNCNWTTKCYSARLGWTRDAGPHLPPAYIQCTCALEHRGYSRGYERRAAVKKIPVIQIVSACYATPAGGAIECAIESSGCAGS